MKVSKISADLSADLSADASADALAIINISNPRLFQVSKYNFSRGDRADRMFFMQNILEYFVQGFSEYHKEGTTTTITTIRINLKKLVCDHIQLG